MFILVNISERKENEGMSFTYSAAYADLFCDSSEKVIDSKNSILQKVKQQIDDLNCIQNATCALEKIDITNCQQRFKRDILEQRTDDMTAGFDLKITCDPGACKFDESSKCVFYQSSLTHQDLLPAI